MLSAEEGGLKLMEAPHTHKEFRDKARLVHDQHQCVLEHLKGHIDLSDHPKFDFAAQVARADQHGNDSQHRNAVALVEGGEARGDVDGPLDHLKEHCEGLAEAAPLGLATLEESYRLGTLADSNELAAEASLLLDELVLEEGEARAKAKGHHQRTCYHICDEEEEDGRRLHAEDRAEANCKDDGLEQVPCSLDEELTHITGVVADPLVWTVNVARQLQPVEWERGPPACAGEVEPREPHRQVYAQHPLQK
mmetsp:Transcript_8895/g.26968  ORF Transcript_8895/g.26968 Transcript_8895/m.26968 type:complete len:250 (-) Transcript_8895:354-1103(-)